MPQNKQSQKPNAAPKNEEQSPQESEEEFEESRAFVEDIHFFETHIFKYSRREGTRAAAMAGQIPEQEKTKRSHVLLELQAVITAAIAMYEEDMASASGDAYVARPIRRKGKRA